MPTAVKFISLTCRNKKVALPKEVPQHKNNPIFIVVWSGFIFIMIFSIEALQ